MNFYRRLGFLGLAILVLFIAGYVRQSGTEKNFSEKSVIHAESSKKLVTETPEQPTTGTEAALRERVNAYWQQKIKGEFAETYLYEHPDFRKGINLTNYVKGFVGGMTWRKVDIESVSIDGDFATVLLKINYILVGIYVPKEGLTRDIRNYWQWTDDGHWYHRFRSSHKKTAVKN
ncbi:MAG: hypothetical protein DRI57_07760 [Deltaproteobacteria bacterium]|nr:MAG: hypothetical protein DRI57_07760 [Deltaproteobacteria bacterium]